MHLFKSYPCAVTVILSLLSAPAVAQDTSDSLCASGAATGNSYDGAALAPFIEGPWSFIANGTGYTQGTQVDDIRITYDRVSQGFRMSSADGPTVALRPINSLPADTSLTPQDLSELSVSYTYYGNDGDTPVQRDVTVEATDLLLTTGCTFDDAAAFWWEFQAGGNWATGVIMFASDSLGMGHSINSGGGTRSVVVTRAD